MQRLELQFYSFFMVALSGAVLGLLFDLLRALRRHFSPNRWIGAAADLSFWAVATAAVSGGLFHGNWGELRFYVLVSLLLGAGGYFWLASPVILGLLHLLLEALTWTLHMVISLILQLVWAPVLWLAGLLWGGVRWVYGWLQALAEMLGEAAGRLLDWLLSPFTRPYRLCRLHYLLLKRRIKRRLRRWLLGPPKDRR